MPDGDLLEVLVQHYLPTYPRLDSQARVAVQDDVAREVAAHLSHMPPSFRAGAGIGLGALDLLAVPLRGRRLVRLTARDRDAVLTRLAAQGGPARNLLKLIRSLVLLHFYEQSLVKTALSQA